MQRSLPALRPSSRRLRHARLPYGRAGRPRRSVGRLRWLPGCAGWSSCCGRVLRPARNRAGRLRACCSATVAALRGGFGRCPCGTGGSGIVFRHRQAGAQARPGDCAAAGGPLPRSVCRPGSCSHPSARWRPSGPPTPAPAAKRSDGLRRPAHFPPRQSATMIAPRPAAPRQKPPTPRCRPAAEAPDRMPPTPANAARRHRSSADVSSSPSTAPSAASRPSATASESIIGGQRSPSLTARTSANACASAARPGPRRISRGLCVPRSGKDRGGAKTSLFRLFHGLARRPRGPSAPGWLPPWRG